MRSFSMIFKYKSMLNVPLVLRTLGMMVLLLAAAMIPSFFVSVLYREQTSAISFFTVILLLGILGGLTVMRIKPSSQILKMREGFLVVGGGWILASLLGAIPFTLSGSIPSFVDAFFETASGFSTTGSSILTNVEALSKGMLFWRSFTHWLGGMGILVFAIALLPQLGISGQRIASAETPGPTLDKLKPKISDSAKILYIMYGGMTVAEAVLLKLCGMDWFDSLIHTFGTVGTGGLSDYNDSVGHFNSVSIDLVISLFMIMAGINFNLYYLLLKRKWKAFFRDAELRLYLLITGGAVILIAVNLYWSGLYDSIGQALRYALFQSSSIITTTGYSTANFDLWPDSSKTVLFMLMFVGGCSASTSGSIKVTRIIVLGKMLKRGFYKKLHPRAIYPIKIDGNPISADTVSGITSFIFLYIVVFFLGSFLISFQNFDLVTTFSATAACLGNVGPGFALVGPAMNYSIFNDFSKIVLSLMMIMGRLELFTILVLLTPTFWNPDK